MVKMTSLTLDDIQGSKEVNLTQNQILLLQFALKRVWTLNVRGVVEKLDKQATGAVVNSVLSISDFTDSYTFLSNFLLIAEVKLLENELDMCALVLPESVYEAFYNISKTILTAQEAPELPEFIKDFSKQEDKDKLIEAFRTAKSLESELTGISSPNIKPDKTYLN